MKALTRRELFAYGALALPLAAAQLPVYVQAPQFYTTTLGLNLALVGTLLLALRMLDALSDPLLGYLSDRAPVAYGGRRFYIALAIPLIAVGFVMLFTPPAMTVLQATAWLAASLAVVYLGISMASINYFVLGAELSHNPYERTRVTAVRGAVGLVGVLLASALPEVLAQQMGKARGLAWFAMGFVPVLIVAALIALRLGPKPLPTKVAASSGSVFSALRLPLANPDFRRLAAVYVLNGVAAAIPATLILFFVDDVLRLPKLTAAFLLIYFVCGAAGMPLWVRLSAQFGKRRAWLAGMLVSIVAFIWAFMLGAGDAVAFAVICALSGLAFGADLALPASMLADVVDRDERTDTARPDGAYFGLWHLIEKLNLALAAGLSLPLLAWLGYRPGAMEEAGGGALLALSATYALLPCAIKLGAAGLLWWFPLDADRRNSLLTGENG